MKYFIINKYLFLLCFFNISFFYASQTISTVPQLQGCYKPLSFDNQSMRFNIEVTYQLLDGGFRTRNLLCPENKLTVKNGPNYTFKEKIFIALDNTHIEAKYTMLDTEESAIKYACARNHAIRYK